MTLKWIKKGAEKWHSRWQRENIQWKEVSLNQKVHNWLSQMNSSAADRRLLFVCPGLVEKKRAFERETDTADFQLYENWQGMEAVWWETFKAIIRRLNLIPKTVGLSTELGKTERCNQGHRPEIEINHTAKNGTPKQARKKMEKSSNNLPVVQGFCCGDGGKWFDGSTWKWWKQMDLGRVEMHSERNARKTPWLPCDFRCSTILW